MAAMFSLDIEKQFGSETWTNRYILSNPTIDNALFTAQAILDVEMAVHTEDVTFTRYRVADLDPNTDVFVIVPVLDQGAIAKTSDYLPLFNVLRVDFPAGLGRPSRKYYRLPIQEHQQAGGVWDSNAILTYNQAIGVALGDIDEYVDVDGEPLGTGVCFPNVAMRQLRRGSKRRQTPVLG